ncbi:hypothetical protein TYRP_008851 [Tyrophagus putrescentiae]|nr:hypothetical protein TYRP_008851 [Tyrophagus putrescentiae]
MFHSTTHYKHWIFADEEELSLRRVKANESFISECEDKLQANNDNIPYLKVDEEANLVNFYLSILIDFCCKFKPPMPKNVISTSVHYFKRFYLNNSAMEHHPKHIMVTCVFLATKIEEFNITMDQFVSNIRGDKSKAAEIVLNNEMLLLNRLNYELTISHPYRPVEGFLIDIKTRYTECTNPEHFRKHIDQFLDKSFYTDACFLFSPNQLALFAIIYAAEKFNENLDPYLRILFDKRPDEIGFLKKAMQKIMEMMNSSQESQLREIAKPIEAKLDQCQLLTAKLLNPEQQQSIDDDDDEMVSYERYSQYRDESEMMDREFIQRSSQ